MTGTTKISVPKNSGTGKKPDQVVHNQGGDVKKTSHNNAAQVAPTSVGVEEPGQTTTEAAEALSVNSGTPPTEIGEVPKAAKDKAPASKGAGGGATRKAKKDQAEVVPEKLSEAEAQQLAQFEEAISAVAEDAKEGFGKTAGAFYQIQTKRLYRAHGTFTAYFKTRFGYSRAHANRFAQAGEVMEKMSPRGDILKKLDTESHFRPLTALLKEPEKLEQVFDLLEAWDAWTDSDILPAAMVHAAKIFITPPTEGTDPDKTKNEIKEAFTALIAEAEAELPEGSPKEVNKVFQRLKERAKSLAIRRTTEIEWATKTWNPLQGCTRKSPACDFCYAARLLATRLADMYPGLAKKNKDGTYAFCGKILLLPERLGDPLLHQNPEKYFVNSTSDLFHPDVPEDFITAVFDVMEKAPWHTFLVLTKRVDRMAEFTQKRYCDSEPLQHIWMGATTENQETFDERMPLLKQVEAKVRWLSCEPLLGPITLTETESIDWVVVGGESNGKRKMEKAWAADLRDQCAKSEIAFYFKQWGDFNEEGEPQKGKKVQKGAKGKKGKKEKDATLDGKIHHDYPE
ncbi:MAG: phage Gp37/Gp68 family protein [Verrucomicrobiaceae bacterium]|nr:MAG: phage Gp37/Gp68 family protein [Verrucomicrobiaceae bacterium]